MAAADFWWKEAKLYELYIDKFAGTLVGLEQRLDYFGALGVNTLHLLPHFPSPMVDEGYDVSDYRGVREELGTMGDFKHLLEAAHAKGLHIVIDFPLNHTSQDHPWFVEARSSKKNPKRDWYLWRDIEYGFEGATNAFPDIKPSNWIYNQATGDYYYATFYAQQPDLNWDNPEVFDAMMEHMEFWAGLGVDGFRLDAVIYLIKREGTTSKGLPETHDLVRRIRARLEAAYPGVILLAEAHQSVALTKQYFGQGDECHMAYHFPLMEQLWMALALGEKAGLEKVVEESADIPESCQWATFLRNHDDISLATLPPDDRARLLLAMDPGQVYMFKKLKVTCLRLATALQGNRQKIVEALQLLYSLPGAPVMYYGDELGMQNLPVEEGAVDPRLFVRGPFDWAAAERQMDDPQSLWSEVSKITKRVPLKDSATVSF